MEKITFEGKEKKEFDIVNKLKKFGVMAALATSTFLQSCQDGPKEKITSEDLSQLNNKIENTLLEKVSTDKINALEDKIKQSHHYHFAWVTTITDEWENGRAEDNFYIRKDNDSTIAIDAELNGFLGNNRKENPVNNTRTIHVLVDKKTNNIIEYAETRGYTISSGSHFEELKDTLSMYVVAKDGTVAIKNYSKGDANSVIEQAIKAKFEQEKHYTPEDSSSSEL